MVKIEQLHWPSRGVARQRCGLLSIYFGHFFHFCDFIDEEFTTKRDCFYNNCNKADVPMAAKRHASSIWPFRSFSVIRLSLGDTDDQSK